MMIVGCQLTVGIFEKNLPFLTYYPGSTFPSCNQFSKESKNSQHYYNVTFVKSYSEFHPFPGKQNLTLKSLNSERPAQAKITLWWHGGGIPM